MKQILITILIILQVSVFTKESQKVLIIFPLVHNNLSKTFSDQLIKSLLKESLIQKKYSIKIGNESTINKIKIKANSLVLKVEKKNKRYNISGTIKNLEKLSIVNELKLKNIPAKSLIRTSEYLLKSLFDGEFRKKFLDSIKKKSI